MRASNLYAPTLRNTPAEAEIVSHQLMYRAGMIRKVAGGMYTFLPLGWRVIRKIEQIIREEMDAAGGQEIMMPILQPGELWQESGRWSAYGAEMMRMKDRHGRDFCLGPTHEEMITDLVRDELHSYKQLPVMLYQIQDKFRDERRPRFGLMRSREFIMKDLYSFDKDPEGMMVSYQKMYDAYSKIYTRMGLEYRPVEADSGAIGGGHSHEFTVLADAGESNIAYCSQCDYAASDEKAELKPETMPTEDALPLEKVSTPGTNTIESLCDFLKIPAEKTIKAVAYQTDTDELVLVFIRGDHDVNEVKVLNQVEGALELRMADEDVIQAAGGCPGFMGPIGIKKGTHVFVDASVMNVQNGVTGANEKDVHYKNVNPQRDFDKDAIVIGDFRMVKEGDPCPHCGAPMKMTRGIEAGQVFALGTKYSAAMGATFLDEQGKEQPLYMGCYGIGVGRTMAAAIEQNNDKDGIVWPRAIAPFEVVVAVVNAKKDDQLAYGEEIYKECQAAGIDTLLDDRKERAGVKFKDCDLIGYPLRVTIGPKAVEGDTIEIKVRKTGEVIICQRGEYLAKVQELLKNL
ncbi:proline--tRNA ligase [uncultured Selenomonas sp.]|uniref:proline--tRNA ligase n=1 Tax=uncultured Selenomonas sp. TaxID=159275 RepID=UPI0025D4D8C7|nr:proline--tRNA ligase [uncultured Selenomonas sp.]